MLFEAAKSVSASLPSHSPSENPPRAAVSWTLPELLDIKKRLGLPDDRYDLKPAGLCEVDPWTQMCGSHGCSSPVTPFNPMTNGAATSDADLEALVQKLTDEIVANLSK